MRSVEHGGSQKSKKTVGEKLRQAYRAATVEGVSSFFVAKESDDDIEKRKWSCHTEDPIRIMMFLGSWSHT